MYRNFIFIIATYLLINPAAQAIVSMEGLHFKQVNEGLSGAVDLRVSGTSGNTDTQLTTLNAQIQSATSTYVNLAMAGYKYGKSNGIKNIDSSFLHFRHIHKINESVDYEIFTQASSNEFTRLSYRGLLGAGLRFPLHNDDKSFFTYIGAGLFHSKEEIDYRSGLTDDGVYKFTRANLYWLGRYQVNKTQKLTATLYYQPDIENTSDYRVLFQAAYKIKLNDTLNLKMAYDVTHDSQPPQTIKQTDSSFSTGIEYQF